MLIQIQALIDDARCFEMVRTLRWPEGVRCSFCSSPWVNKRGRDDTQIHRQRYECRNCSKQFDDLTGTVFARHHQSLKVWMLCLYLMGLNLSNRQIAHELELNKDDVQAMTQQLRQGVVDKSPVLTLEGAVEIDEVYVVAGHKGQPGEVQKKGARGDETVSKGLGDAEP